MKLLTHLLTIYILLLSMFPCPEDILLPEKELKATIAASFPADDECDDECSPFCSCACCAVQMMRVCNCMPIKTPELFSIAYAGIQTFAISDIYLPIWQPPQLS